MLWVYIKCIAKTLHLTGTLRINTTWLYDYTDRASPAYIQLSSQVYSAVSLLKAVCDIFIGTLGSGLACYSV